MTQKGKKTKSFTGISMYRNLTGSHKAQVIKQTNKKETQVNTIPQAREIDLLTPQPQIEV